MTRSSVFLELKIATAAATLVLFGAGIVPPSSMVADAAYAQHGGGQDKGGGHDSGHDPGSHDDDSHEGESGHQDSGSQGTRQGRRPGETSTAPSRGHDGLDSILRDAASSGRGGMGRGGDEHGSAEDHEDHEASEDEESDRPDWAGGGGGRNDRGAPPDDAGSARGDLYGDMWVILRDANGVPILNADGFVQPIAADGSLIPLDEEGAPIDPTLAQEIELGRLNVGRSPDSVLTRRSAEVVTLLNSATTFTVDAAGRIVVTTADGTKTIDAPLENLALYVSLMTTGTIPGVTDLPGTEYDFLVDGTFTTADVAFAAALIAAAADKADTLALDDVAYMNAILGINIETLGTATYSDMDYSAFSYDRSDTFGDVTTTVLVQQPDGSWKPTQVNVFDSVFGSQDYSATGTFAAFAQAADDARLVINYLHEYAVPVTALNQ